MYPNYLTLGAPVVLALLAVVNVAVWSSHRKHLNLLWLAGGLVLVVCAQSVYAAGSPATNGLGAFGMALFGGAAAAALAQSMAMRFGRRIHLAWTAAGAGLVAVGGGYFMLARSAEPGLWVTALGLALILGHVLPVTWRMPSRHRMERRLLVVYTAISVVVLLSPWWAAVAKDNAGWEMGILMAVGGGLLTAAMVGVTLTDGLPKLCNNVERDELTGLLSRSAFESACHNHPATQNIDVIVLCDLDNFQRINNQFGATAGNEAIRSFALLLQASVREGDHAARMGAEAFGLALRDIDMADAQVLVQRISLTMRQQHWGNPAVTGPLTASFGVATVRENDSLAMALHRADVLLCQAKDMGFNRIAVEEQVATSAAIEE